MLGFWLTVSSADGTPNLALHVSIIQHSPFKDTERVCVRTHTRVCMCVTLHDCVWMGIDACVGVRARVLASMCMCVFVYVRMEAVCKKMMKGAAHKSL